VVTNTALITGIVALINPIDATDSPFALYSALLFLLAASAMFILFLRTHKQLTRWEGIILVVSFALYIGMQILFAIK
jgi:Ca2+/Na+ antiporter